MAEIKRTKQAITEGRLWEHLEIRSHGHPALLSATKQLSKYADYLEANSPVSKKSGLFFYGAVDLARPEVTRHAKRLEERYTPPEKSQILLLLPQTRTKPFHRSREHARIIKNIERTLGLKKSQIHICTYSAPFGVVPTELDEVYPLSQHEVALPLDYETITHVARQVESFLMRSHYRKVILLNDAGTWGNKMTTIIKRTCKERKLALAVLNPTKQWSKQAANSLSDAVQKAVGE